MGRIKGITVNLFERCQTGRDGFNAPVWEDVPTAVENVLIGPVGAEDVVDGQGDEGRRAVYELYIPKGDTHQWEGCRVDFFGERWRVFTPVQAYIEGLTPLEWNKRVKVERYE